jgi:hypothetical protein
MLSESSWIYDLNQLAFIILFLELIIVLYKSKFLL